MSFNVPSAQNAPNAVALSGTNAALGVAQIAQAVAATTAAPMKPDSVATSQPDSSNHLAAAVKHFSINPEPPDHHAAASVLHGLNFGKEMETAAKKYGIDPVLLAAVAAQESGGGAIQAHNIDQRNGLGRGIMQIDIGAWPDKASIVHDPAKSADFGAFLLKDGFNQADRAGDAKTSTERTKEALRVYNGSSPHAKTTTTQWPDGRVPYEESVLRHYAQIEKFLASPASR